MRGGTRRELSVVSGDRVALHQLLLGPMLSKEVQTFPSKVHSGSGSLRVSLFGSVSRGI